MVEVDSGDMADPRDVVSLGGASEARGGGGGAEKGDAGTRAARESGGDGSAGGPKPWLQLWFSCARQYARANRTAEGSAYVGNCPTCGKCVRFQIGAGGTSQRLFEVSCR